MDMKDVAVPLASGLIAIGMSLATVTATAQDADDLSDRMRDLEVKQAGEESTKVIVKQNTERLERLEEIIGKLAEAQAKSMANQAAICQATGAECVR
jgi:4-hydroxy-3-methylbut-2-enyl diphosphate reductase IspH